MKYLKLFEEMKIEENEFPKNGHDLSPRERKIITDLVGEGFYLNKFTIKVEDHYYYVLKNGYNNMIDNFNDLKDYILFWYYIDNNKPEEFLELLKRSNLDPTFDTNLPIRWAIDGRTEIVRLLLKDKRVDPSVNHNCCIGVASNYGHTEIIKLLLNDSRVRDKLTQEEIIKYTNRIKWLDLNKK